VALSKNFNCQGIQKGRFDAENKDWEGNIGGWFIIYIGQLEPLIRKSSMPLSISMDLF
jgi:hypothetical protein